MKMTWTPERLKELRKRLGKNQAEFAPLLRVPIDTLQNWEQGRAAWPAIAEFRFEELAASLETVAAPSPSTTNGKHRRAVAV